MSKQNVIVTISSFCILLLLLVGRVTLNYLIKKTARKSGGYFPKEGEKIIVKIRIPFSSKPPEPEEVETLRNDNIGTLVRLGNGKHIWVARKECYPK